MATGLRFSSMWAVIMLAGASAVFAQPQIWSAAGVTGIVDDADLNIHSFNTTGSVAIKASVAAGTLDIRFPVQTVPNLLAPQPGDCAEMRVNLRDRPAHGAQHFSRLGDTVDDACRDRQRHAAAGRKCHSIPKLPYLPEQYVPGQRSYLRLRVLQLLRRRAVDQKHR
jgi:hypothetical protein